MSADRIALTLIRWEKDGEAIETTADGFGLPFEALTQGATVTARLETSLGQTTDLRYAAANRLSPLFSGEILPASRPRPLTAREMAVLTAGFVGYCYLLPIAFASTLALACVLAGAYAGTGYRFVWDALLLGFGVAAVTNMGAVVLLPRLKAKILGEAE